MSAAELRSTSWAPKVNPSMQRGQVKIRHFLTSPSGWLIFTRAELERLGAKHWVAEGIVGPASQQIFMKDPAGNMIELHQVGKCRCQAAAG